MLLAGPLLLSKTSSDWGFVAAFLALFGCLFFAPGGLPLFLDPYLLSVSMTKEGPSPMPHTVGRP